MLARRCLGSRLAFLLPTRPLGALGSTLVLCIPNASLDKAGDNAQLEDTVA